MERGTAVTALTPFQDECASRLQAALNSANLPIASWEVVAGRTENYIQGASRDLRFFVYQDGADIQGEGVDMRYEAEDYESSDLLMTTFIKDLLQILQEDR